MTAWRHKLARVAWLAVAVGAAAILRLFLIGHEAALRGLSPGCFMRRFTGLYCPGCGGTRAFFALLRGNLEQSWQMNPLLPAAVACGMGFGLAAMLDRRPQGRPKWLQWVRVTAPAGWLALALIILFGISRNLPWWPFTLLSPPT